MNQQLHIPLQEREGWPKLSETLPHPRRPDTCQACGTTASAVYRWREHDEWDRPTNTVVVLCDPCAAEIIEPHPRLYDHMPTGEPLPGTMLDCEGCRHHDALTCRSPLLKANGGPGLPIDMPKPSHVIACVRSGKNRGCHSMTIYNGPVTCHGIEPIEEPE